jgi:hypothetical protein
MSEHTKGLLALFRNGQSVGSADGTGVCEVWPRDENGFPDGEGRANARRIVACWNACHGLPTDELEQKGLACAFGTQLLLLEQHRDTLLEALNDVQDVMNNSQGVAGWHKNGDIATWESWRLEVIDLDGKRIDKVLATRLPEPADEIGAEQEAAAADRSEAA